MGLKKTNQKPGEALPVALRTFVLPNLLGGLGADFHASTRTVSLSGGAGAFVPGLIGCFLFPVVARRLRLRSFCFANGILGCLFTLSLRSGKQADLVLLDANPLDDIHNTQKIRGVVVRGRWLDRTALDELLAHTKSASNQ
jgi:hypothetical protein